jgi:hypothetical protein
MPVTAANKVFGVAGLAGLGPAGIDTCFVGADAIGACPVGVAVPAAARTPTATAAVIIVVLVAMVMVIVGHFLSHEGSLDPTTG